MITGLFITVIILGVTAIIGITIFACAKSSHDSQIKLKELEIEMFKVRNGLK